MAPENPYRVAEPNKTAGPEDAAEWEYRCGWSEGWYADRFVAEVRRPFMMATVVVLTSAAAGVVCAWVSPLFFGSDGYIALGSGLAGFVAVCIPLARRARRGVSVRIEVTPETTTVTWMEATSTPTPAVRDVEVCRPDPDPNGDDSTSWGVRYTCGERTVVVPMWTGSEHEAQMRAERLRRVFARFEARAPPETAPEPLR